MKCDIVYIVGSGSKWDNNELRYSLRSIAKNGLNVGRVFIVGEKPGFVSDKVIHIQCMDIYRRKHKNMCNKILKAVEDRRLSNGFWISGDDHFYIKPFDFGVPRYFYKGKLPATVSPEAMYNGYWMSILDTRVLLEQNDLPIYNSSLHLDTYCEKKTVKSHLDLWESTFDTHYGCEPMSIALNTFLCDRLTKPEFVTDIKLDDIAGLSKFPDAFCFSISDKAVHNGVADFLQRMFPEPCKYEK